MRDGPASWRGPSRWWDPSTDRSTMRQRLQATVDTLLDQVARRGSWVGGGSAAALTAALAAALLQKLVVRPTAVRKLRRIRAICLRAVTEDATRFAGVIHAVRRGDRATFRRTLKVATELQWSVFQGAQQVQAECRTSQRRVKPRLQSDLLCAMALALAASEASRTLILTNVAWLNDASYTQQFRRRLQRARPARS